MKVRDAGTTGKLIPFHFGKVNGMIMEWEMEEERHEEGSSL